MLKTYRRIAILAAFVPTFMMAQHAHAQDAEKTAAIKELLSVMQEIGRASCRERV